MRLIRQLILPLLLGCVVLGPGSPGVSAHADYERSEPPAGATIPQAPDEVHVWFTQELFRRAGANPLEVIGPGGTRVDKEDARIDDDDRAHMIVSLQAGLPAGTYTVRWRTLSAEDGDTESGEFNFTVDPAAVPVTSPVSPATSRQETSGSAQPPAGTLTPASSPTPASLPTPASTPPPQETGGMPCLGGVFGAVALVSLSLVQRCVNSYRFWTAHVTLPLGSPPGKPKAKGLVLGL